MLRFARAASGGKPTSALSLMDLYMAMRAAIGAAILLSISLEPTYAADQFGPPQPGLVEGSDVVRVCSAEGTPQELFAELFIEALRQRGVGSEVTLDPKEFRLIVKNKGARSHLLYLNNAY